MPKVSFKDFRPENIAQIAILPFAMLLPKLRGSLVLVAEKPSANYQGQY